jgi:hypothetical protein
MSSGTTSWPRLTEKVTSQQQNSSVRMSELGAELQHRMLGGEISVDFSQICEQGDSVISRNFLMSQEKRSVGGAVS